MVYLKWLVKIVIGFILIVLLYATCAFSLSRIVVEGKEDKNRNIPIFILTNGVHTDIVLPVNNGLMNWAGIFPYANTQGKDTAMKWIALGWGDKGFYLETPTWAQLKVSTALKAVSGLNTTAIHATYYKQMFENNACVRLAVNDTEYLKLVNYILKTLQVSRGNRKPVFIPTHANYGPDDAFYEARGHYSLFFTCNTWANGALKMAGHKACLWTVLDKPIFSIYHH